MNPPAVDHTQLAFASSERSIRHLQRMNLCSAKKRKPTHNSEPLQANLLAAARATNPHFFGINLRVAKQSRMPKIHHRINGKFGWTFGAIQPKPWQAPPLPDSTIFL